jgi:hypothetical protein
MRQVAGGVALFTKAGANAGAALCHCLYPLPITTLPILFQLMPALVKRTQP